MARVLFRLALALAVLAAFPAFAAEQEEKLSVRITNKTPLEVVFATFKTGSLNGGSGELAATVSIVPGNYCEFVFGGESIAKEILLDMGLAVASFPDLALFSGRPELPLTLGLEGDTVPYLELAEEGQSPVRVRGSMRLLISEGLFAQAVDLTEVIASENMAQVRALAAKALAESGAGDQENDKTLVFPVRYFGDRWWVATVEPEDEGSIFQEYDEKTAKIGNITLRTQLEDDVLKRVLGELFQWGDRPWFLQFNRGEDMDMVKAIKFHDEEPDMKASWERMRDLFFLLLPRDGSPAAVEALLIPDRYYAQAISGEELPPLQGVRVRVSNSVMLQVKLLRDCGTLVNMTR